VQLLKLRYFQLKRDLSYWVPIIATAVFFIAKEISGVSQQYSLFLTAAIVALLYAYHLNRRDLNFITHYLRNPALQVAVNYNLLVLPVSIALLVNHYWLLALALHAVVSCMVLFRLKPATPKLAFIGRYVAPEHFEWIAGLRTNLYSIVPLLLLALVLSPVKLFGVVALFMLNSIFMGFYSFFEPLCMLNPNALSTDKFLNRKVYFFSKIMLLLNVPLLTINALCHPEIAWFNACLLLAFLLLAACAVFIKYANYKPNERLGMHADFIILFAGIFVPYLLPLGILIYFSSRKKAIQNLLNYTDDHSEHKSV
jgi:hypothetical protein